MKKREKKSLLRGDINYTFIAHTRVCYMYNYVFLQNQSTYMKPR